jgi:hypothetical protein
MAPTDEEDQAAASETALSDKLIFNKKKALIALAGLVVVMAVTAILGTTLGGDNSGDSAANLRETVPQTEGKSGEGIPHTYLEGVRQQRSKRFSYAASILALSRRGTFAEADGQSPSKKHEKVRCSAVSSKYL